MSAPHYEFTAAYYAQRAETAPKKERQNWLALARAAKKLEAMSPMMLEITLAEAPPPIDWDMPRETILAIVMPLSLEACRYLAALRWLVHQPNSRDRL